MDILLKQKEECSFHVGPSFITLIFEDGLFQSQIEKCGSYNIKSTDLEFWFILKDFATFLLLNFDSIPKSEDLYEREYEWLEEREDNYVIPWEFDGTTIESKVFQNFLEDEFYDKNMNINKKIKI